MSDTKNSTLDQVARSGTEILSAEARHYFSALQSLRIVSAAELPPIFLTRILPLIESFSHSRPEPGSPCFFELHFFLHALKKFFLRSHEFETVAHDFIRDPANEALLRVTRTFVSWAAGLVELHANRVLTETFMRLGSDKARLQILFDLSRFGTQFRDPIVHHERIPQIELEMAVSRGSIDSRILIIGSGPLPLTGLAWAARGADVMLVDRDPRAFMHLDRLLDQLPDVIRQRISMHCCEAQSLDIESNRPTHVMLAGMLDAKAEILRRFAQLSEDQIGRTTFLMRVPKRNLMEAYMYPIHVDQLTDIRERWHVETGPEAGSDLYLLRLGKDCRCRSESQSVSEVQCEIASACRKCAA